MRRFLPTLLILFAGSGCAALIYEVVWFQLLQLVIGSSALSLGVLLGTYMGGMCLGSALFPRVVPVRRHPLKVVALIEAGIGVCGLLVLFGMPHIDTLYAAIAVPGFAGLMLRAAICAVCLLAPTMLMGASLPALARWIETTPAGVSWMGFFYAANLTGAVMGSLLAGFYLLRLYDMAVATYAAAGINFGVAAAGWALAVAAPYEAEERIERRPETRRGAGAVLVVIGLSGLCALGAEVVWTRLLSLILGGTVYTFSIILAVFLAGLGLGGAAGSALARRSVNPRLALGLCQLMAAAGVAWAAYAIASALTAPGLSTTDIANPVAVFKIDVLRCAWAILPAACLWGASFPLALAARAGAGGGPGGDPGALAGSISAANTAGAIAGALGVSMILIPAIGTQQSQRVLVALAAAAAMIALAGTVRMTKLATTLAPALVGAVLLLISVPVVPWVSIAYGRAADENRAQAGRLLYVGEGVNSSIVISEAPNGVRYFHVGGRVEATTEPSDMRLQRMLAHIPALFHAQPRSVLVVGFGAGVTAGALTLHPDVARLAVIEIEPLVPRASAVSFARENYGVLGDFRTTVYYDDARHFVLTAREKFDIITSDPIHPWMKGTAPLYSREYFELCKRHLNPGGIMTQWVPLYESDFTTVKSEIATFFEVFPHATVWNSDVKNRGYDVVLAGQAEARPIDVEALERRLRRPDYARVVESLAEVGIHSPLQLLATYAGRQDELAPWVEGAVINRDLNLRLQYLAGWGLNFNRPDLIYRSMLIHRTFPKDFFVGSEAKLAELRQTLDIQGH